MFHSTNSKSQRRQPLRVQAATLLGVVLLWGGLVFGCGCGASTPTAESAAPESEGTAAEPASATPPPDAIKVVASSWFDSGPLRDARRLYDNEQWAEAADAFVLALDAESLEGDALNAADMMLGYSQMKAERFRDAQQTFSALAEREYVLRDYARVLAGHAAHAAENYGDALDLVSAVPEDSSVFTWRMMVEGLVHYDAERLEKAIETLEAHHDKAHGRLQRKGRLTLARALRDVGHDDAMDAYQRVVNRHGKTREGRIARKELAKLRKDRGITDVVDTTSTPFERANRHYKAHRSEKAIKGFEKIRKGLDPQKEKDKATWCEATYLVGKSHTKLRQHDVASTLYDEVIAECANTEQHINALYNGGRAHWNADRNADAIQRFETIISDYAEHSFADDAYLYIARIQAGDGDSVAAEATLRKQLLALPDGDMAPDAHWLLFLQLYRDGRLKEAVEYVDTNEDKAGEDTIYTRGRLAYFRGRALEELDREDEAMNGFESVIDRFPLSYYALVSFARLSQLDAKRAAALASRLRSGTFAPNEDVVRLRPPALATNGEFLRGVELIRLGFVDWAELELQAASSAFAGDDQLEWTLAALYDVAGAHSRSHRMAARLTTDNPAWPHGDARAEWAIAYPRPYLELVREEAGKQLLVSELVYSIMREESGFEPRIESWANARGLMQLMLPTAQSVAPLAGVPVPNAEDLFLPEHSIPLGVAYLGKLGKQFAHHPIFIIAGYNGGQGNLNRWLAARGDLPLDLWVETIPFGQTRHYTKRVLTTFWRYTWLYSEDSALLTIDPSDPAAKAAGVEKGG